MILSGLSVEQNVLFRILLEAGAEIDNKNEDEQTPIHLAAINGRPKVVELIVE